MDILVTGGAGFIGSHLCERLVSEGHRVYSLDNYSSGSHSNEVDGVTYIDADTKNIEQALLNFRFNPEMIYHLGEYSRVEQSFQDVDLVMQYNYVGTFAVLEYVRKNGCKLLYAGSSTKYGDNGSGSSPYAWSKSNNTELVKKYGEWYNIDYRITYFYNVYGGREISSGNYSTLIAKFKDKVLKGEKLTVVSPGTQLRNFTYIEDIINALILIGEHGQGDEYGIGNDKAYSVLDVANLFGGEIEMLPERKGNRLSAPLVTEKTKALGWSAKTSLEDHIKTFLKENNIKED